jgi:hypothetical protein
MRTRVKKVPATTNNITQAIINFLRSRGHWAARINNGAVYDPEAKAFRRKRKDDPALGDISGVLARRLTLFRKELRRLCCLVPR